ncbi:alpha/beta hydrolase [Flavobacterium aciduliphilum]|uniref:Phospholipase/carboxylesterase n=1 Tax=Flavobacterium aciduliphilum TaxID=1101402 RepID=A0A328YDX3_9FLAO|nr:alpha/beta fold hydrolase [Flavobacterium aciduliphilum]RAR70815.1 phospholipase/carboxylesterase [Flavobacterium aciduliphilum]
MTLNYLIKEPTEKNKDRYPLLLLLHGYGSNEKDLFSFASELPNDCYIISLQAPYEMMHDSYAWYAIHFDADENKFSDNKQAQQSRNLIVAFIDDLIAKYPLQADDVTLIGFSQGSILSYAIAVSYPTKIRRVVALSGYFNEEIATEDYAKNDLSTLRIFASHGTVDQVIPVSWAQNSYQKLQALNIDIVYKEYTVGHGVAPQNFYDFKNWLLEG